MRYIWLIALIALVGCDPLSDVLIPIDDEAEQGIFGIVTIYPGVCLVDEENGECLNKPFPGQGTYDVRRFSDVPDSGFDSPIVKTFTSQDNGFFQVSLDTGEYCVWWGNSCEARVSVTDGEWAWVRLGVFLP